MDTDRLNTLSPKYSLKEQQHEFLRPQLGEVEPNLKKILHRNGIWGLEAIVM